MRSKVTVSLLPLSATRSRFVATHPFLKIVDVQKVAYRRAGQQYCLRSRAALQPHPSFDKENKEER
jgi:hypothetical protein